MLFNFYLASNNASQPSPAPFDVALGTNSIGNATAGSGQGILPSAMNQGNAGVVPQISSNAVGGMPRPAVATQNQQNMAPVASINSQLSNPPISASGSNPSGPVNRITASGSSMNVALPGNQQSQQAAGTRNIKGSIADSASNLELIVRTSSFYLTFLWFNELSG